MMLGLYKMLGRLAWPVIRLYLAHRLRLGKEDVERFDERFGRAGKARPEGRIVWFHGASIGEGLSLLPLIDAVLAELPDVHALVTTGTVTSARMMTERLPARAIHQYVPVDTPACVGRFLDHWRPDFALWAESEFWPMLVSETQKRGVPMVLVNGRMSMNSFQRWLRHPGLIRRLLSGFALVLGQTDVDCERFFRLGAPATRACGNLKFVAAPLPADEAELARMEVVLHARPRWLAASTHAGEEAIAGRVHQALKPNHPGLLTIIAPRHPNRADAVEKELRDMGLTVARRSRGDGPSDATDVYLADTVGEMGLFYRLSEIAFLGKSMTGAGGQNPIEPARLEVAILTGPHIGNFEDVMAALRRPGALDVVANERELTDAVALLLADDKIRHHRMNAAKATTEKEAGVMARVMTELNPYLTRLKGEGGRR